MRSLKRKHLIKQKVKKIDTSCNNNKRTTEKVSIFISNLLTNQFPLNFNLKREHGNEQWAKLILCMMISGINTNQHYYTIVPPTHASLKKVLTVSSFFCNHTIACALRFSLWILFKSSHRGEPARRRRKLCKISYAKSHWLSQLFSESPLDSERFSFFITRLCLRTLSILYRISFGFNFVVLKESTKNRRRA